MNRFSEYRIMWILVFFDLPTETKKDRKIYAAFRKALIKGGFVMFQFSTYMRHCASKESAEAHIKSVQKVLPPNGNIGILSITDKQFAQMEIINCRQPVSLNLPVQQLELF